MSAPCSAPSLLDAPWFGKPGAMMLMPRPDAGWSSPITRGAVAHSLNSGGTSTTRRRKLSRIYALAFSQQTHDDADDWHAFYSGTRGTGPFLLLDPNWRNIIDLDASAAGVRGFGTGWDCVGGSLAVDGTVAPPSSLATGVLRWTGAASGSLAGVGIASGAIVDADPKSSPPVVPGLVFTISVYMRTVSGSASVRLGVAQRNGDGSLTSAPAYLLTAAVTSSWQRFEASATAVAGTQRYAVLTLSPSALPPDVLIAAPQFEYGVSAARPWVTGMRVPRVSFGDPEGLTSTVYWRRSTSYVLAEN